MARERKSLLFDLYNQPYGFTECNRLSQHVKDNVSLIQRLKLIKSIKSHHGCVNSICWNETGEYILSGSDDQHLCVVNGFNYKTLINIRTSHRANIFCAKFLPSTCDKKIISCSGDGTILFTDLENSEETKFDAFHCHSGTTYELMTIPNDPYCFVSCGEDGTVRWFDLRMKQKCDKSNCKEDILIYSHRAVTSMSIDPVAPYNLAVGSADGIVRMFDRRLLGTAATGNFKGKGLSAMFSRITIPTFEGKSHRITSLAHSRDGAEILVSYCSDHIYLFNVKDDKEGRKMLNTYVNEGSASQPKKFKAVSVPPLKRLRLRGDWSDTGPHARPESENNTEVVTETQSRGGTQYALMQRMSDVVTSILNDRVVAMANREGSEESSSNESEELQPEDLSNETPDADVPTVTVHLREVGLPSLSEPSSPPAPGSDNHAPSPVNNSGSNDLNESNDPLAALHDLSLNISMDVGHSDLNLPGAPTTLSSPVIPDVPLAGNTVKPTVGSPARGPSEEAVSGPEREDQSSSDCYPVPPDLPFSPNTSSLIDHDHTYDEVGDNSSSQDEEDHVIVTGEVPLISFTEQELSSSGEVRGEELVPSPSQSEEQPSSSTSASHSTRRLPGDRLHPLSVNILRNRGLARLMNPPTGGNGPSCCSGQPDEQNSGTDMDVDTSSDEEEDFLFTMMRRRALRVESGEIDADEPLEVRQPGVKVQYTGHRNARTMIKEAVFWGDNYVMSGSDCGHVFVWDKDTAKVVMLMEADHHVVNCVQPHPFYPILASSGIDYDVKIWAPTLEENGFDEVSAETIIHRNKVMLEETRDTITVPASFMIRMIASLNQLRRALGRRRNRME